MGGLRSSRRPCKLIDIKNPPKDRHESGHNLQNGDAPQTSPADERTALISYSDDAEAAWTVKGAQPVYGYKVHVGSDLKHGFIIGGHLTGANLSDTKELCKVIDALDPVLTADKGYAIEAKREL